MWFSSCVQQHCFFQSGRAWRVRPLLVSDSEIDVEGAWNPKTSVSSRIAIVRRIGDVLESSESLGLHPSNDFG